VNAFSILGGVKCGCSDSATLFLLGFHVRQDGEGKCRKVILLICKEGKRQNLSRENGKAGFKKRRLLTLLVVGSFVQSVLLLGAVPQLIRRLV